MVVRKVKSVFIFKDTMGGSKHSVCAQSVSAEKKIAFGHGSSPVTPTLRRLWQKDPKFGTNLGFIVRPGQERKRQTHTDVDGEQQQLSKRMLFC